jgi:hypothetical protein
MILGYCVLWFHCLRCLVSKVFKYTQHCKIGALFAFWAWWNIQGGLKIAPSHSTSKCQRQDLNPASSYSKMCVPSTESLLATAGNGSCPVKELLISPLENHIPFHWFYPRHIYWVPSLCEAHGTSGLLLESSGGPAPGSACLATPEADCSCCLPWSTNLRVSQEGNKDSVKLT